MVSPSFHALETLSASGLPDIHPDLLDLWREYGEVSFQRDYEGRLLIDASNRVVGPLEISQILEMRDPRWDTDLLRAGLPFFCRFDEEYLCMDDQDQGAVVYPETNPPHVLAPDLETFLLNLLDDPEHHERVIGKIRLDGEPVDPLLQDPDFRGFLTDAIDASEDVKRVAFDHREARIKK